MTPAETIELVCLMEATARKPGNVHPGAAFDDLCYDDFVRAGGACATPLASVQQVGLGRAIYDAVNATRSATATNVNLGIVLLLAPLAAVPTGVPLEQGIGHVLARTTVEDADWVYAAIRLANPGGMGTASSQDISALPTVSLRDAMVLAADRDRVAEQYASRYGLVFEARRKLVELWYSLGDWESAVVALHVWMMSRWPDTLIVRKCGREIATAAVALAADLYRRFDQERIFDSQQLAQFDGWLRADGHRRNPGTTADLIVATLFAAVRDCQIEIPKREEIDHRAVTIRKVLTR